MKTSLEIQVLQLFEQALAQPAAERMAWLAGQALGDDVLARVVRLLDAERAATAVIEQTALAPDDVAPEFPKVGERLGNYELLRPLEAGGMGVVYLGRRADDVYEQQVAIKLVRPVHLLAAADFRRQLISRFEDERSILARMSHPNVARILDGGSTAGGIPYLVMEYVDGVSLTDYCRNQKLDVPARLALFCKVCDGVQEAHRHLIVHRDLKPDNILVGANGEPRLLDFGIAKILEQEPLNADKGTSLSAMTPAYASPEQVRQEALTTSSDVYSLGVVLYQLLAGVRPYELAGLRPAEAEHLVCETLPESMHKMLDKAAITDGERKLRRSQLAPDVERIVARAMHKESARRYGSAQELADDIRRYLSGQPVQAHPDSVGYRARKFLGRHRIGAAAATLALAAILTASGVAFWQAGQARRAASDMGEINGFLMDVLRMSNPYETAGELSLSDAVDSALVQVDKRFAGRPALSAGVRFALGYSMLSRNQLALAEPQLALALADSQASMGAQALRTLQIREAIAQLRIAQGRTKEAEADLLSVLADIEASGQTADPLYLLVLNNIGQLYLDQERYPEARSYLEKARAQPEPKAGTASADTRAILVSNLAYVAHGLGELDQADRLFDEAEAEFRKVRPGGSAELASLMNNRAFLLDEQGKADEAYALRQASLAMREAALGGEHPSLVPPLMDLAQSALMRGDAEVGLALATRAVAISRTAFPQPHADTVFALGIQAGALINNKRFLDAGEAISLAEADLARLDAPPEYIVQGIGYVRQGLCKRPRTPPVPSCAGIEPTEPALP
ncbi:MAG: serine/threonine-protein kinase [Arenimonas sp.]|nr:serine/threonine-protein kinase [Arenimonas sp.]